MEQARSLVERPRSHGEDGGAHDVRTRPLRQEAGVHGELGGGHDAEAAKEDELGGIDDVITAMLILGGGTVLHIAATLVLLGGLLLLSSARLVLTDGLLVLPGGGDVLGAATLAARPRPLLPFPRPHRNSAATLAASGTPTIAVAPFLLTLTARSPALTRTPTMSARFAAQMPSASNTRARRSVTA